MSHSQGVGLQIHIVYAVALGQSDVGRIVLEAGGGDGDDVVARFQAGKVVSAIAAGAQMGRLRRGGAIAQVHVGAYDDGYAPADAHRAGKFGRG